MTVYAVYDTNVIVSALISKSSETAVVKAFESLLSGEVIPLYNSDILSEYKEVLHRDKFNLPEYLITKVLKYIETNGVASERVDSGEVFIDPGDAVFYEVALSKGDSFLVTGNTRHFPNTPIVVTPSELLDILRKQRSAD